MNDDNRIRVASFGTTQRRHVGTTALQGRMGRRSQGRVAVGGAVGGYAPRDAAFLPRIAEATVCEAQPEPEAAPHPSVLWAGRLELDMDLCATSPVVKGTRVTVRRVVSMVVDGWSWAEILQAHPELTVDDVRACLAYCTEEENAGSFDYQSDDAV